MVVCILLVFVNRTISQVEIEAISEFLFHLLTGDVDKLRTETLVQSFWTFFADEHKQASEYLTCLRKHRLTKVNCYHVLRNYCGERFGQKPPERIEQCRLLLEGNATLGVTPSTASIFANYTLCFRSYRQRVKANCTEVLRKVITSRRLRATKVVRATMDSMGPLLRLLPTLRVIHLVRDPRAVALSRINFGESGRGMYTVYTQRIQKSTSGIVAEASLYCNHVTADIRSRLALERKFPGRILTVRYEDVVSNPEQRFRDIYKFLDEPMPNATFYQMQMMAKMGQSMNLATKWQRNLKYIEAVTIARLCAEFYRLMNIPAES